MNISIIDGNSVGYAAHYGTVLTSGNQQTQAVYGFVRTLADLKAKHPDTAPIVVWDGRAKWRFELCPTYKSNRHSDDPKKEAQRKAYKTQVPLIQRALKSLGVHQMLCATHEADDLAGLLVAKKKPEDTIFLVTSDRDWLQLIRRNVIWCDARSDKIVTTANFFEATGYRTPEAFLDGKCLKGDTSDAIQGVGGIGEKGAPEFLAQYGTVRNFFNAVDAGVVKPTKKAHKRLASPEGRQIYETNWKVMQLLNVQPIDKANLMLYGKGQKNTNDFINLCHELAFQSILANPNQILDLF